MPLDHIGAPEARRALRRAYSSFCAGYQDAAVPLRARDGGVELPEGESCWTKKKRRVGLLNRSETFTASGETESGESEEERPRAGPLVLPDLRNAFRASCRSLNTACGVPHRTHRSGAHDSINQTPEY